MFNFWNTNAYIKLSFISAVEIFQEKDLTYISMRYNMAKNIYACCSCNCGTKRKRMIIKIGSTLRQLHHKVVRERCVMIVHQRL